MRWHYGLISLFLMACGAANAELIRVGAGGTVATLAEAARRARPGDVVELPEGELRGQVAVWTQAKLKIRGAGSGTTLNADGASAEGKGTFVVRGGRIEIENITFTGAKVPSGNGAGIRLESGALIVRDCRFLRNEMGILTSNDPTVSLVVERSEFGHNGGQKGNPHNLYAGTIARLEVSASYFHHARIGHLLKSRARESLIQYNRLTDEEGGQASYELEFPNGGKATVIGNLIEQSATTENPNVVSFGAEGYPSGGNKLVIAYNTFVDDRRSGGNFLRVHPGNVSVSAFNNLLVGGNGKLDGGPGAILDNNHAVSREAFAAPASYDFRLRPEAAAVLRAQLPADVMLAPIFEYVHPHATGGFSGAPVLPGAFQSVAK